MNAGRNIVGAWFCAARADADGRAYGISLPGAHHVLKCLQFRWLYHRPAEAQVGLVESFTTAINPRAASVPVPQPSCRCHTTIIYPLVINIAIEHGPFIVDLPIKHGDFPKFFVCLPEGKHHQNRLYIIPIDCPNGRFPVCGRFSRLSIILLAKLSVTQETC